MNQVGPEMISSISEDLENNFGSLGFEFQPFKIGWYNAFVQPIFKLNYDDDAVAFLIISAPIMFENAFIPFLEQQAEKLSGLKDPIDECMLFYLSKIPQLFPNHTIKVVHDFELHPNRRPKIVMQTVAHASGAAYYYNNSSIEPTNDHKKMYGVCIHPRYGGWFALRAVALFEDLQCPNLVRIPPLDVVPLQRDRMKLLELFNGNWADWKYRDIITVCEKYSDLQKKYFSTSPSNRGNVIKSILQVKNAL